jgi:hypothetical protein
MTGSSANGNFGCRTGRSCHKIGFVREIKSIERTLDGEKELGDCFARKYVFDFYHVIIMIGEYPERIS